jgi:hypothetical protein
MNIMCGQKISLPLVKTNGTMNSDKRALAPICLLNWAKARAVELLLPLVLTNGNEYFAFLDSFPERRSVVVYHD